MRGDKLPQPYIAPLVEGVDYPVGGAPRESRIAALSSADGATRARAAADLQALNVDEDEMRKAGPLCTPTGASAARFLSKEPPARSWVWENVIPAGRAGIVIGAGGSSKSWLTCQLGVAIAADQLLCDQFYCSQGGVLMIAAEDDEAELHRRFWLIAKMLDIPPGGLTNLHVLSRVGKQNLLTDGESGELHATGFAHRIVETAKQIRDLQLVILDPLARFRGGEENSASDSTRVVEALEMIAVETRASVLAVHHANKASASDMQGRQTASRGSSALVDGCRYAMVMRPMETGEAQQFGIPREECRRYVELSVPKSNYGMPVGPYWLERMPGGVLKAVDIKRKARPESPDVYADVLAKVRAFVEKQPTSARELEREHGGTSGIFGVHAMRLRSILNRAIEEGALRLADHRPDGGKARKVLALPSATTDA